MADPAGNRTAFVTDPVSRDRYAEIGNRLLQNAALRAEQVGFILDQPSDADGAMCMSGGEFCGNATRSFGYLTGKQRGLKNGDTVHVRVSGSSDILAVTLEEGGARVRMPCPGDVMNGMFHIPVRDGKKAEGRRLPYVEMEGITHILIENSGVVKDAASAVTEQMRLHSGADAAGVMFLHAVHDVPVPDNSGLTACKEIEMTPFVWVRETDSHVWESSCGSGSLSAAVFAFRDITAGRVRATVRQPGGVLTVLLEKKNGHVSSAYLGGPIKLEEAVTVGV